MVFEANRQIKICQYKVQERLLTLCTCMNYDTTELKSANIKWLHFLITKPPNLIPTIASGYTVVEFVLYWLQISCLLFWWFSTTHSRLNVYARSTNKVFPAFVLSRPQSSCSSCHIVFSKPCYLSSASLVVCLHSASLVASINW